MADDGLLSSFRYLFADFLGEEDDAPPFLPEGLPETVAPVVSDAIHLLIDYQGLGYAQLYVDRVRRFVGRRGVDEVMLADIARLMAMRMAYEDPIRIAQLKLAELDEASGGLPMKSVDDVRKFRLDEMVGALPAAVARTRARCARPDRLAAQAGPDALFHEKPLGHSPSEDRGGAAGDGGCSRCAMPRSGSGSNAGCT